MQKLRSLRASALLLFLATPAIAEPKVQDLKIEQADGWVHASGKPVETAPDPLKPQAEPVGRVPANLQIFWKGVQVPEKAASVTLECEAYLENSNMQGGFVCTRKGEQEGKGYFFGIEAKSAAISIALRGGHTGPWESLSKTEATRPPGWAKIKFTWWRDGVLELYINGDLYLEQEDRRLAMLVDQVQFQTNGEGAKYLRKVTLTVEP